MQSQAKSMIQGIKQEIYGREHPTTKKPDSVKSKITGLVVYFSKRVDESEMFAGPLVDTLLRCSKSEVGIVIPAVVREDIVPLFLALPWSYRDFSKLT